MFKKLYEFFMECKKRNYKECTSHAFQFCLIRKLIIHTMFADCINQFIENKLQIPQNSQCFKIRLPNCQRICFYRAI